MTEKLHFNKHFAALSALFILGDAVIVLPYGDLKSYTFLGFIAAVISAFLLYLAAFPVSKYLLNESVLKRNTAVKLLSFILCAAVSVYAFYSAGLCFIRFTKFINEILLPDTHIFIPAAVFILITALLAFKGNSPILKFSVISAFVTVIIIALFFILSAKDFMPGNMTISGFDGFFPFLKQVKPYFLNITLPALLLPAYGFLNIGKIRKSSAIAGFAGGAILMTFSLLDSLLLFGAPLSSELPFPLAAAASTVTVGPLFSRMDGFIYFLFFITALIKTVICIKLSYSAIMLIKRISNSFK